jgi:hypothetical protein
VESTPNRVNEMETTVDPMITEKEEGRHSDPIQSESITETPVESSVEIIKDPTVESGPQESIPVLENPIIVTSQ